MSLALTENQGPPAASLATPALHAHPSLSIPLSLNMSAVSRRAVQTSYTNIGLLLMKANSAGRYSGVVAEITRGSACAQRQGAASLPFNHQNPTKKPSPQTGCAGQTFPVVGTHELHSMRALGTTHRCGRIGRLRSILRRGRRGGICIKASCTGKQF